MVVKGWPGPGRSQGSGVVSWRGWEYGRGIDGEIYSDGSGNWRHAIWSSNLNTIKGHSLVFLWILFWDWNSTTQIWGLHGNTETGQKGGSGLLMNSVQIFYVDVFINQNGTEMFIYFWNYFPDKMFFPCFINLHLIHIYLSSSPVNDLWLCTNSVFSFITNYQKK